MTSIDIQDYAKKYLTASIKKIGGIPNTTGFIYYKQYIYESKPILDIPARDDVQGYITKTDGPHIQDNSQNPNATDITLPIRFPTKNNITIETSNGYKSSTTITQTSSIKLDLTTEIPKIGGTVGGSFEDKIEKQAAIDMSGAVKKVTTIDPGTPDRDVPLHIPAKTKVTYRINYYGANPEFRNVSSKTVISGGTTLAGVDSITGKQGTYSNVLAAQSYTLSGHSYVMVMTADQIDTTGLSGYTRPSGVKGNKSSKDLTITGTHTVTIEQQETFRVVSEYDPPRLSEQHILNKHLLVHALNEDEILEEIGIVILDSDMHTGFNLINHSSLKGNLSDISINQTNNK